MSVKLDIKQVLDKHHRRLKAYPNVLSIRDGVKWENDKMTDKRSIVIFVPKKLPLSQLSPLDVLPKEIEGIPVDVVELSTTDYRIGKTSVSDLSSETQRRMASGVKKK